MVSVCTICKKEFNYYPSRSSGRYCGRKCLWKCPIYREKNKKINLGRIHDDDFKQKVSKRMRGFKFKPESIKIRSERMKITKNRQYQERIDADPTIITFKADVKNIRESSRSKRWRKEIIERDGVCVNCGSGEFLEVDHIIPFASLLSEAQITNNFSALFDADNGRLLCFSCHKKFTNYNQFKKYQIEYRLQDVLKQFWQKNGELGVFNKFYCDAMDYFILEVMMERV